MSVELNTFTDNETLVSKLASQIESALREAITQKGSASIAVSGGSTPVSLFHALARIELPWEQVTVSLIDERWVARNHQDSNERLVRENLLTGFAAKARFVGLKTAAAQPSASIKPLSATLKAQVLPLDIAVLGMGEDGHTASFFSGSNTLYEALDLTLEAACVAVVPPEAPYARMTLSLASILSARRLFLHFLGEKKFKVFEQAVDTKDANLWPVAAVLVQKKVDVEVYYATH